MSRVKKKDIGNDFGFFGIGILNNVNELNIGTLWRSAYIMGASFIFTIDKKYKTSGSDVTTAWTKIPLYHYSTFEEFKKNIPYSSRIVGVEMDASAVPLEGYEHPNRVVYLLGNERIGLPKRIIDECHDIVRLAGEISLNVAVVGSIVMYDRSAKRKSV